MQLADRPSLAGARAGLQGCVAFGLKASDLRALIIGSAELGEIIMRALILRRIGLLERGVGPVLLGRAGSSDILRLQSFLSRSTYPHLVVDCASERGRQLIDNLALPPEDLPIVVCPCGRILKRPTNEEIAAWLGITPKLESDKLFDLVVIGAGPAGLCDRCLCGLGRAVCLGRGRSRRRRPGRCIREDRELPRFPDGHIRVGVDRTGPQPSAEIRRGDCRTVVDFAARTKQHGRWRGRDCPIDAFGRRFSPCSIRGRRLRRAV